MNSVFEVVMQYVFAFAMAVYIFTVAGFAINDLYIRIKAKNNPKYARLLEEQRKYNILLQKQDRDYRHDVRLLKDIHKEKMAEIKKGVVVDDKGIEEK